MLSSEAADVEGWLLLGKDRDDRLFTDSWVSISKLILRKKIILFALYRSLSLSIQVTSGEIYKFCKVYATSAPKNPIGITFSGQS